MIYHLLTTECSHIHDAVIQRDYNRLWWWKLLFIRHTLNMCTLSEILKQIKC